MNNKLYNIVYKMFIAKGGFTLLDIITLKDLSIAIVNEVGVSSDEAYKIAEFILDLFGYDDRIIDNVLDPGDRQLFYILEEEGMVVAERERTTLYNGKEWRSHYWRLRKNNILRIANKKIKSNKDTIVSENKSMDKSINNIYDDLSEDIWSNRKINITS